MAEIIDGKKLSQKIRAEIQVEIAGLSSAPGLAVIIAGDNPASAIYVRNKEAACRDTGITSYVYHLPQEVEEGELFELIDTLNADKKVNGILVQLPLPPHIGEKRALSHIDPAKDVDGFHAINAGNLLLGGDCLKPCTPSGIIELIKSTYVPISGLHAVIVGRSNIVGKPAAIMLLEENATVTMAHSRTRNLKEVCATADILVAAIGKAEFITGEFIKPGAIIIDVGINRTDKLYGDVKFDEAEKLASYITPVPGGVGPMTITMLLANTLKAYKNQNPTNV